MLIQERLDAAYEHKTVKQFLMDLARARLAEMARRIQRRVTRLGYGGDRKSKAYRIIVKFVI